MNPSQGETNHSPWVENLFRPLVLSIMVGCIAWSLVQVTQIFAPTWNSTYLLLGCMLAALDAYYSYRLLQTPRMRGTNVLQFRLIELLLLFVVLKVGRHIGRGGAGIIDWPRDISLLFDPETLVAFVLAGLCWGAATDTAKDLHNIGETPERRADYVSPAQCLTSRFFEGGAVLLVAAGLSRIGNTSDLLKLDRPSVPGVILNVLIYFLLGIVLLGQARFIELRKRWEGQKIKVADEVPGRWVRYSFAFIGLAALAAFVLPTAYTLGFLESAALAINLVGDLLTLLFFLLALPFRLLYWLFSRLIGNPTEAPAFEMPQFEPSAPAPGTEGTGVDWFALLRTLAFWAILLGVLFYAVRSYLRDRPELWQALTRLSPLRALRRGWAALWRWLRERTSRLGQIVSERMPRLTLRRPSRGPSLGSALRFLRLGALSPRERVLYYYLSILRRADKHGYPRQKHQTPHEYHDTLKPHLPQAEGDMASLTDAFVQARYSRREVEAGHERGARAHWERVKAALRALKR